MSAYIPGPADLKTIWNGLRVAAEVFDQDAKVAEAAGHLRTHRAFVKQAEESRRVMQAVEDAL